jgi:hypothetical protein
MQEMTERKPPGTNFESWIDRQVREAEQRGLFEDLPGTGKPLNVRPGSGDYGQAWIRDYALREGVPAEEMLPTPLRLRREAERLEAEVPSMASEADVAEAVSDLNRRVVEWRRIPDGPPVHVRLVNKDAMLARWREARAGRPGEAERRPAPGAEPDGGTAKVKPRPWWKRLLGG